MKKKLTVLLVMALISTMLFGCESSDSDSNKNDESATETDSDGKIYTNDFDTETNQKITLDEIEFEVPENWIDTNSSNGMIFEPEGGQLYVVSEKGPYDFSSEEKQDAFIDTYENVEDFSETGRETITVLDDISALYFTYTCVLQEKPSKCYQIQFSTDTLVYGFLYADYDESEYNRSKDFDEIIASISWNPEEVSDSDTTEKENTTTEESSEAEYITTTFDGMTFSYPSDCEYEETDDYATITLEASKEFIQIIPYGELEEEEDSTISIDTWLETYLASYVSNYDNVSDQQIQDMTVAGCEAKGMTAICTYNSNMISFSGIAVYSNQHNVYGIYYNYAYGAEGRLSDYEAFLDSISFE